MDTARGLIPVNGVSKVLTILIIIKNIRGVERFGGGKNSRRETKCKACAGAPLARG